MYEQQIGKRIQEYRKKKGLKQDELATMVGISKSYLSTIERGMYSPHLDIMVNIMNCLDCSADEIFADVVNSSFKAKSFFTNEKLEKLPSSEQKKIFEVIDVLIKNAKN